MASLQSRLSSLITDIGTDVKALLARQTIQKVAHGSTAGTARPSGITIVYWVGTVEPTNATADDFWVNK